MSSNSTDVWAFMWAAIGGFFHFYVVFRNNFAQGSFVRLTMFIIQITFTPCAATCLRVMFLFLSFSEVPTWAAVSTSFFCLAAFPLSVPFLQFRTLSSAQQGAIGQIMRWPGQTEAPTPGETEQQYGALYLRQQVKVDPKLVETFGEENVAMMPLSTKGFRWRRFLTTGR